MLNPDISFSIILLFYMIVVLLKPHSFESITIVFLIILFPLSRSDFVPRSSFGISGLNPFNFFWLIQMVVTIISVFNGKVKISLRDFFLGSMVVFAFLYFLAYVRAYLSVDDFTTYGKFFISHTSLTMENFFKPLQIFLFGFLVFIYTKKQNSAIVIYQAVVLSAILLGFIALLVFLNGSITAGSYTEGRSALTHTFGYHANSLGAVGVFFLTYILVAKEKAWEKIKLIGIGAAILIIALSFSRIAYLTTFIFMLFFYRKLNKLERRASMAIGIIVVLSFSAELLNRIGWGLSEKTIEQGQTIDAGRIEGIWLPLLPQIEKNLMIGSGMYGILKSDASKRGLHVNTPHSAYLEVLVDMGFLGLITLFFLFYRMYVRSKKVKNSEFPYILFVFMMLGLTGHSFYPYAANFMVFTSLGVMCFHYRKSIDLDNEYQKNPVSKKLQT